MDQRISQVCLGKLPRIALSSDLHMCLDIKDISGRTVGSNYQQNYYLGSLCMARIYSYRYYQKVKQKMGILSDTVSWWDRHKWLPLQDKQAHIFLSYYHHKYQVNLGKLSHIALSNYPHMFED